jgi:hypothetical protein
MAIAIQQISPVAHLPLVLGVVRQLNVAALIDTFCPPHPAHVLSCGRGVEALLLAILDGHHALYKLGARLEERGMLPLLQPGLKRASLHDYRLGQILDALFAAHLRGLRPPFWHDGTERPIQRPKAPEDQQEYYSGKKKGHTLKNLLVISETCHICFLSLTYEGRMHEKTIAELEGYR